jgi:hypothetical protein
MRLYDYSDEELVHLFEQIKKDISWIEYEIEKSTGHSHATLTRQYKETRRQHSKLSRELKRRAILQ